MAAQRDRSQPQALAEQGPSLLLGLLLLLLLLLFTLAVFRLFPWSPVAALGLERPTISAAPLTGILGSSSLPLAAVASPAGASPALLPSPSAVLEPAMLPQTGMASSEWLSCAICTIIIVCVLYTLPIALAGKSR